MHIEPRMLEELFVDLIHKFFDSRVSKALPEIEKAEAPNSGGCVLGPIDRH